MYDNVVEAVKYIQSKTDKQPKIAVVLGSGLTAIKDQLTNVTTISFEEIPHFKNSSVKGHSSYLMIGTLGNKEVCLLSGRLHFYEGYTMQEVTFPYYVLHHLGVESVILTNSCGGINDQIIEPGNIMVLNDFINFMPLNPLIGPNDERFGPRFPDMTEPYVQRLRDLAKTSCATNDVKYIEGVYASHQGPYYETKAEIQMLKILGADVVGMSTVPETIVCNYLGMEVLAFATITNMATGIQQTKHSHDNVVKIANQVSQTLGTIIQDVIQMM